MIEVATFPSKSPADSCPCCDLYKGRRYYGDRSDGTPVYGEPGCDVFFQFKRNGSCLSARMSGVHGIMRNGSFSLDNTTANFAEFCPGCDNYEEDLKVCKFHPGYNYLHGSGPANYVKEGTCYWAVINGAEGMKYPGGFKYGQFLVM